MLGAYLATVIGFTLQSLSNATAASRALYFTSGHVCQLHLALVFLPVTRNSLWIPLLGVSFERAIKFHRWLGRIATFTAVIHLLVMLQSHASFSLLSLDPTVEGQGVLWGTVALALMILMSLTAFECVRRSFFEWFYHFHLIALPLLIASSILHNRDMLWYFAGPVGLWILDRMVRFYRSRLQRVTTVRLLLLLVTVF